MNFEVTLETSQELQNTTMLYKTSSGCMRLPNVTYLTQVNIDTAVVTYATEKIMYQVLQLVASVIICIAGIPTNFINLMVFFRLGLKDRVNACLFWLSFCDMMSLAAHILRSGELAVRFYSGDTLKMLRSDLAIVLYDYGLGTIIGFRQISFFMYAFIALDRCLCVLMPLRVRQVLTNKLTVLFVVIGSLLSFTLNSFSILSHGTLCVVFLDTGSRGYLIGKSQLVKAYPQFLQFSLIVDSFILGLALPILFLATVITSTIITATVLRQREDWLRQVTFSSSTDATPHKYSGGGGRGSDGFHRASGQEVAITKMLVVVSSVYIFCTVPLFLHRLVRFLLPGFLVGGKYSNLMTVTFYVYSLLVNVNASINFAVFYWQGSRFRKQVHRLFSTCSARVLGRHSGGESNFQSDVTEISNIRGHTCLTSYKARDSETVY